MARKYYLGLDMGTSSLGWAVTDPEYHLIRAKGKDLWGVRLFQEAESAAVRRTQRVSRRRLQREKARIGLVKEIFSDAIEKVDPGFYQRLDDSKYFPDDKTQEQRFALFAGDSYTDKDYYKDYPTVFHLRSDLIHSKEPKDVRLVYRAILNIFKHRGHFLNANLSDSDSDGLEDIYAQLVERTINFPSAYDVEKMKGILASRKFSNSRRSEQLMELLQINKKMPEAEMIKLICGLKGVLSKAFPDIEFDEENKKFSVSFREGSYEEKDAEIQTMLDEDSYEIVQLLKQMHDWGLLAHIMGGEKYLSDARIQSYNKHADDLRLLKELYREYGKGQYNKMFRIMADNNYSAYVGSVNSDKEKGKVRRGAKKNRDEFYSRIKKDLKAFQEKVPQDERIQYVLDEIDKESFLPKQLTSANGVIPNQVHLKELRKILSNAEGYLPFLRNTDESGLTNSEKIVALFSFQIPYYIGPLYNDGAHNAWVVRREAGRVLPWNFNKKIDVKASSEEFIQKMVRHCTYIQSEYVLPKNSLLYEKFMVLNELNNLKINGNPIGVELKQSIYNDLFRREKKVTDKKIREYLIVRGLASKKDEIEITGIDGDFKNSLSSYLRFREIFSTDVLSYEQEKMAEKIIFWATVYGDSKSFLKERIKEKFGDQITDKQIKRICGIKFRDWGRLSKAVLELEGADRETGEVLTLIGRMWNENVNLMECLSGHYTYIDELQEKGREINKSFEEIEYEDLEDLYISAPVRRMVWQTILVVREIVKVMKCPPAKIFIEMARDAEGKNDKTRKDSRKKKFEELYKGCKEDGREWSKEISDTPDSRFRSKKLYLYYTQKGRCMYTGEPIELGDLFNDNLYDIDHIYPRHFVKDDSIEKNLVLVKKQLNSHKSDTFPIEAEIRRVRFAWWKNLCDQGFITKEKFERLVRSTQFSEEELASFISRQIVETRQGTKTITDIFENSFPESEIIYSKAGVVSDFRHKFDLIKCREVNNFHHANDAYLNIVVGNAYNVKFTKNPINFVKQYKRDPEHYKYHMDKLFDYPVIRGDEVAWKTKGWESIRTVRSVMARYTPLVTRMNYEEHGQLWDINICSADDATKAKGVGYVPVSSTDGKMHDVTRYGGYKKYTGAYFFLVEHTVKKQRIRTLEAMPLYLKDKLNSKEKMEQYCKDTLGYQDPSVRLKKIKMYSLIKVNGFLLYLTGRTNKQLTVTSAVETKLQAEMNEYVSRLIKCTEDPKNVSGAVEKWNELVNKNRSEGKNNRNTRSLINKENNKTLYDALKEKHTNGIYKNRPNSIGDKLAKYEEEFESITIAEQLLVLKQILQLTSGSKKQADLSLIGGSPNEGVPTLNKKINGYNQFMLVSMSPSGIYEYETDMLTI